MAFVTDVPMSKVRFSIGVQPKRRRSPSGLSFPAAATIASVGAVAAMWLATSLTGFHSSTLPGYGKFPAIALTTAAERERFQNHTAAMRDFHPEKTSRLYPTAAGTVITHVAHQYQIPPRESVASVNVPVEAKAADQMASVTRSLPVPPAVDATKTASLPPSDQIASAADAPDGRFGLVMRDPGFEAPLPLARPDIGSKAPVAKSDSKPAQTVLAYANPNSDNSDLGLPPKAVAPKMQAGVAIYDISAHTVYMPDGTRFEAHSGLGQYRDKPQYTTLKAKGPTPPNTYKLSMRESLFHGVPALRMTPEYPSRMHGRGGILTHTYLRRRPGDSAGCIAFKDYYKFLKYYKRGDLHTIIVVPKLADAPSANNRTLASLFGG